VSATAGIPSSAARRARSSGENAPSFREKKDRTSRCTNPGEALNSVIERMFDIGKLPLIANTVKPGRVRWAGGDFWAPPSSTQKSTPNHHHFGEG
jgi:hypothetical protein